MAKDDETTPFSERKVVRRGLIAGLAGLGAAAMMKLTGSQTAEAAPSFELNVSQQGTATTQLTTSTGAFLTPLLDVANARTTSTAIQALGGPGSALNAGGRALDATGGSNSQFTSSGPSDGGGAIRVTGGSATVSGGGGVGVEAIGGNGTGGNGGTAVLARGGSPFGTGVRALGGGANGNQGEGVFASTNSTRAGVRGLNSGNGPGVQGESGSSLGVRGLSHDFVGVVGISDNSHGLYGSTGNPTASGLVGENLSGGTAGFFQGNVQIFGSLQVFGGPKNAIIRMKDGTDASVYCQESPEPWFEDFGRGQLTGGVANVALEPEFATLVAVSDYMVFLTPSGDTRGLYVAKQDGRGFEVRETQGGTGSLGFTYRIVTRRKDIEGKRFARVSDATAKTVAAARAAMGNSGTSSIPPTLPVNPIPPVQPQRGPGAPNPVLPGQAPQGPTSAQLPTQPGSAPQGPSSAQP